MRTQGSLVPRSQRDARPALVVQFAPAGARPSRRRASSNRRRPTRQCPGRIGTGLALFFFLFLRSARARPQASAQLMKLVSGVAAQNPGRGPASQQAPGVGRFSLGQKEAFQLPATQGPAAILQGGFTLSRRWPRTRSSDAGSWKSAGSPGAGHGRHLCCAACRSPTRTWLIAGIRQLVRMGFAATRVDRLCDHGW